MSPPLFLSCGRNTSSNSKAFFSPLPRAKRLIRTLGHLGLTRGFILIGEDIGWGDITTLEKLGLAYCLGSPEAQFVLSNVILGHFNLMFCMS